MLPFVSGSRLGSDPADIEVTLGDTHCTVTSVTETSLACDVGEPPAGAKTFTLKRHSMGLASSSVLEIRVSQCYYMLKGLVTISHPTPDLKSLPT